MKSPGCLYRNWQPTTDYDAIVIGSGIGGLATAAFLARQSGLRVLVLERHNVSGGMTHVFRRKGYEWDVGVHYVGEVGDPRSLTRSLFAEVAEDRLQWQALPEIYDRIVIADRSYDLPAGRERFRAALKARFPAEAAAINRYVALVDLVQRASGPFFAEKVLPPPLQPLAGPAMRAGFLRYAKHTSAEVIGALTRNSELAGVLTGQWGNYGLRPECSSFAAHALMVAHYLEGSGYPVGGPGNIAAAIAPTIEEAGGTIVVGAEVAAILLNDRQEARGVRLRDGRELTAPLVISDAGARNTFHRLLPPLPATAGIRDLLSRVPPSDSYACLYAGFRREPNEPDLPGTNLWIHPGPNQDENERRYYANTDEPLPIVYISFPSAKDPTFAERHPGRSTIEVVTPAYYEKFSPWHGTAWRRRGAEYEAYKEKFAARLRQVLEEHVPAVRGRLEHCELSTPLSVAHFTNAPTGETYGLSAVPERFVDHQLRSHTPIANLFLTGQDVCTAGVVGSLLGAAVTASAVLGRDLVGRAVNTKPMLEPQPSVA